MKSQTDQNGHQKGALTRHANKSSRGGNKKRKNESEDKFCELHHTRDHSMGECKVLKAQARKMRANWETHWSKQVDRKNGNKSGKREELNSMDFEQVIESRVKKVLEEYFPRNQNPKRPKTGKDNDNFNLDDFNQLSISDNEDSDSQEWPCTSLISLVSRELISTYSGETLNNVTRDEVLVYVLWEILEPQLQNDNVTRNGTFDNEETVDLDWEPIKDSAPLKYKLASTFEKTFATELVKDLEVLNDSDSTENQPNEEAFVLCQVFNKTEKPAIGPRATLAPILFARVRTGLGKPRPKDARVLLDSGASSSIISYELIRNLRLKESTNCMWVTAAGTISTSKQVRVQFMFPELSETRIITWNMHVFNKTTKYDLIIGRDLLQDLGILLDFKNQTISWDEVTMPISHNPNAVDAH